MKDILSFISSMFEKFGIWRAISLIMFSAIVVFFLLYGNLFFNYLHDLNEKKLNLPNRKDLYTHQLLIMYEMRENRLNLIELKNENRTKIVRDFIDCAFENERNHIISLLQDNDVDNMESQELYLKILSMVRISLDETMECMKKNGHTKYEIDFIQNLLSIDVENFLYSMKIVFDDELKKDKIYNVYKIKVIMDMNQKRWEQVEIKLKYEINNMPDEKIE